MSLEDRFRQALADAISEVKSRLEAEFDATVTDVKAAAERDRAAALVEADEARSAAVTDARGALQAELQAAFDSEKAALVSTHESLIAQAADAARLEAARLAEAAAVEADRQRLEGQEALARATADAAATVEAIRQELRDAQASAVRVREESEAALARLEAEHGVAAADLRIALDATTRERDDAMRQREELAAEVAHLREQADVLAARMREEFDESTARLRADFDAGMSQARELAEAALASLRAEAHEAATLHAQAVDAHQQGAVRLLESVRALDGASSLTEVLDSLTTGAGKEAGRAAMLVVKGDRLVGWRTLGFGALDREPRAIDQSTSDVGALSAAVHTGHPAVTGAGSVLSAPAFSDAPADRAGLAVPLLVAGRPVAVLYADQGATTPVAGWTSPVEVLVRHAARCLEGLAVQRATAAKASTVRVAQSA